MLGEMTPISIGVQGWRAIPHSYAIVNQFQCDALAQRPDVRLRHQDVAYFRPEWRPVSRLLPAKLEQRIAKLKPWEDGEAFDAVYRIAFPFAFQPGLDNQFVFATYENGNGVDHIPGWPSLAEAHRATGATIVTPSQWSKSGLIRCGADADRIAVVPHGFDPDLFRPASKAERADLRRRMGLEGRFVFLSVGAMTENKGMKTLVQAFAAIASKHPEAVLVLKGMEALFPSADILRRTLIECGVVHLKDRIIYNGEARPMAEMAKLYGVADVYVAPYRAEAFCMPALEAAACGLASIVTGGGPTDDFTDPAFAWRIEARSFEFPLGSAGLRGLELHPDPVHLAHLMERAIQDEAFRATARRAGPAHVARFTWKRVVDGLLGVIRKGL